MKRAIFLLTSPTLSLIALTILVAGAALSGPMSKPANAILNSDTSDLTTYHTFADYDNSANQRALTASPQTITIYTSRVTDAPTLTNQSPISIAWETAITGSNSIPITTSLWYRYNQGNWTEDLVASSLNLSGTFLFSPDNDGYYALTTVAYTGSVSLLPNDSFGGNITTTYDTHPPTAILTAPRHISATQIPLAWHVFDPLAGVFSYTVAYSVNNSGWQNWPVYVTGSLGVSNFNATPNTLHAFRIQASDRAGNVSIPVEQTTYVGPFLLYLPLILENYANIPLLNGDFESGDWSPWSQVQDAMPTTLLNDLAQAHSGQWSVLVGDPSASGQGDVPIGHGRIGQTFLVPQTTFAPIITIYYHFYSQDIAHNNSTGDYLDSFEIYLNTFPADANTPPQSDIRRKTRCIDNLGQPDPDPTDGLVFCGGRASSDEPQDSGWRSVQLNLNNYKGRTVTLYLSSFNRVDGWFNTYTYLDDIAANWQESTEVYRSALCGKLSTQVQSSKIVTLSSIFDSIRARAYGIGPCCPERTPGA